MIVEDIVYGAYGAAMFFVMVYYTVRILENFRKHPELSMANFFNLKRTATVFKTLSIVTAVLSIGYTFDMLGVFFGIFPMDYISVFVNFMMFIVMVYFFRSIFIITCKVSEQENTDD